MNMRARGRRSTALAGGLGVALLLAGCGASETNGGGGGDTAGLRPDHRLRPLRGVRRPEGETVSIYTSIVDPEDQPHIDSYVPFEECTGVDVKYEGSREFEAQLVVRVQSGNAPDIAFIPQPGLLATLVGTGAVVPAPKQVEANVDEFWDESWKAYGTVDGTFYAAPLGANAKSFVWYSPSAFKDAGYEVPKTWDEMIACPTRSRPPAPSRGARASAPVTPPAGRPPTGWRTSSCGPPAPTSTTSGSSTRSPSTTRRSSRRSTPSADPEERRLRQRRPRRGAVDRLHRVR